MTAPLSRPDRRPESPHDRAVRLLNGDFARSCRAVYAYACYAERLRAAARDLTAGLPWANAGGRAGAAGAAVERRGRHQVAHALALGQLVHDLGAGLTAAVDEAAAVRRCHRVARRGWQARTVRRLLRRARLLRAVGRPDLAARLDRLAAAERALPALPDLLDDHLLPGGRG